MSKKARRKVIDIYAMRAGTGTKKPMLCKSNGKVGYPDEPSARLAARRMERSGLPAAEPYLCPHSRMEHYHLTTID